jgi:tetratricopeptide (TPR) repeat protein
MLLMTFSCEDSKQTTADEMKVAVDYFNQDDYQNALKAANELLENDPENYFLWSIKGRALYNLNEDLQGIEAINKAIELNPEYYEAYAHRATMYHAIGKDEEALVDVNVAIKADENNVDLLKLKTNIFYAFGEYKAAVAGFSAVLKIEKNDYESFVLRGIANLKLKQYETVLSDFEQAIALNPNYSFAYEARADYYTYTLNNEFAKAVEDYSKAIDLMTAEKKKNNQAFLYNNRGFANYNLGKFDEAILDIEQSLKLSPKNSYAYKNRALVYSKKGDKTLMCQDLEKAESLGFTEKYGNEVVELMKGNCKK